jgi:hypothetical protein
MGIVRVKIECETHVEFKFLDGVTPLCPVCLVEDRDQLRDALEDLVELAEQFDINGPALAKAHKVLNPE